MDRIFKNSQWNWRLWGMVWILGDLSFEWTRRISTVTQYVTVQGRTSLVWLCLCWCTTSSWLLWCGLSFWRTHGISVSRLWVSAELYLLPHCTTSEILILYNLQFFFNGIKYRCIINSEFLSASFTKCFMPHKVDFMGHSELVLFYCVSVIAQ